MARTKKSRSAKVGLPPGALVQVGEKLTDTFKISLLYYDEESLQ